MKIQTILKTMVSPQSDYLPTTKHDHNALRYSVEAGPSTNRKGNGSSSSNDHTGAPFLRDFDPRLHR